MAQPPQSDALQQMLDTNPQMYLRYLISQRVPPFQATQMTIQKFGPPKTQQQLLKEQAGNKQKSEIAGTIGSLAGMYGASKIAGMFGSGGAAATGAGGAGAAGAGAGGAGAGAAGAGAAGAAGTAGAAETGGGFLSSLGSLFGGGGAAGAGAGGAEAGAAGAAGTAGIGTAGAIGSVPILPLAIAAAIAQSTYERGGKQILQGKAHKEDWANLPFGGANILLKMMGKRSVGKMITGGKSDAQEMRDMFRKDLRDQNIADADWNVTLANGEKYNIGLDGKTKLQNVGQNIDKKTTRNVWDVDWSNPLAKKAVDLVNSQVQQRYGSIKGGHPEQFTGMLVNAITSNAKNEQDLMANFNSVLGQSKFAGSQQPVTPQPQMQRPGAGQVVRVSPGMYRTDTGAIQQAGSIREALNRAYNKGK